MDDTIDTNVMVITTEEEYKNVQERLQKGEKEINKVDGWLKPKYKPWVDEFQKLADASLIYEIEHNLLPI